MAKKKTKKPKKSCCGKFLKKGKHCSRCPILIKQKCKELSTQQAAGEKKEKKQKKKRKKE